MEWRGRGDLTGRPQKARTGAYPLDSAVASRIIDGLSNCQFLVS